MNTYLFDGTIDGLFSCFYAAKGDSDAEFTTSADGVQLSFDSAIVEIATCREHSESIQEDIASVGGSEEIKKFTYAYAYCGDERFGIMYRYLRMIWEYGKRAVRMMSHPYVVAFNDVYRRVLGEAHRMLGFVRFVKTDSDIYYCAYSPDNNVTPIIITHFVDRYSAMRFALHDVGRGIIGLYDGSDYAILSESGVAALAVTHEELAIQALWKKYYTSVNIEERYNKRLMSHFLPKKYRRFMLETETL